MSGPSIFDILGIQQTGLDDSPQLLSLGGPLSQQQPQTPPDLPEPLISALGLQGAMDLIGQQGAPQGPQPIGGDPGFTVSPIADPNLGPQRTPRPETPQVNSIEDLIDLPASAEEIGRRDEAVDRTPVEFGEEVFESFKSGVPSADPSVQAATMMLEIAPGTGEVADVRDITHGIADEKPWQILAGGVGLIPFVGPLLKKGVNAAQAMKKPLSMTPELDRVERYMLAHEKRMIQRGNNADQVEAMLGQLPSAGQMSSAALAGRVKRGWYKDAAKAISETFGPDAPRFAALLASFSPQTSVANNLATSLRVWKNWTKAGRPVDEAQIFDIFKNSVDVSDVSTMGLKPLQGKVRSANKIFGANIRATSLQGMRRELAALPEDQLKHIAVMDAWERNGRRSLMAEDPADLILSGPKVDSFMLNLLNDVERVTLDTWQAKMSRLPQKLFSGDLNVATKGNRSEGVLPLGRSTGGTDPTSPTYAAYSARIRETAKRLEDITGEVWTPSEVQETMWSWVYATDELVNFKKTPKLKRNELRGLISQVTDEDVARAPDFATLFQEQRNLATLTEAGLSAPAIRAATTPPSSSLRAATETSPGVGGEAATAAQRSGLVGRGEPNLDDLVEIADNVRRQTRGDIPGEKVSDFVQPLTKRPKLRRQAIAELTKEGKKLSRTGIEKRMREIKKRP